MSKKVLLITPPYHSGVVEVAGRWLPLSFVYVGGALRKAGYDVEIYDAMSKFHSYKDIEAKIKSAEPDYVATTAYTSTINDGLKVLQTAKEVDPRITTFIGGVHPTFCYEEVLKGSLEVDYVVMGEGERTSPELLQALDRGSGLGKVPSIAFRDNGGVIANGRREFIPDLDEFPAAWDLLDWNDYKYFVMDDARLAIASFSRGCQHDCAFCSQQKFWERSWRGRSPEKFVNEIEHLTDRYGVKVVMIPDENPTFDAERWHRLLDLLIERDLGVHFLMETTVEDIIRDKDLMGKYRQAGFIHIYVGVEATSQAALDRFKKDLKVEQSAEALKVINDAGIITETSLVLGVPEETHESINNTLELAKMYNPDFAHFLLLAPWPYADMYDELKPYIETYNYSKYNLVEPVIKPFSMSTEELFDEVVRCYKEFYMQQLPKWSNLNDEFKKHYLLTSLKEIIKHSFLKEHGHGLGKMPKLVKKYLQEVL